MVTSNSHAPNTLFLSTDGGRVAFDDTGGDGPLILAMPGMGDLRSQYRLIRPALRSAGYRVITMDVRGFGETSAQWTDYSAHAVATDAIKLLDHLDAGPAVIIGNSFTAGSALWVAHDAPARVSGVVLSGPIVRDHNVSWLTAQALKLGFAGPWRVWFWTTYWSRLFPTHQPTDHAQVRSALARNLREPGRMAALQTMLFLSKADTAAIVSRIRVRALIVMGTRDPDFPDAAAEARWLADALGAKSVLIEGAGHYPHTEMPDQVMPELLSFIDSLQIATECRGRLANHPPKCSGEVGGVAITAFESDRKNVRVGRAQ